MTKTTMAALVLLLLVFGCIHPGSPAPEAQQGTNNNATMAFPNAPDLKNATQPANDSIAANSSNMGNGSNNTLPAQITLPPSNFQQARSWYFAFGSNLDRNGMHSRVGDWPEDRPATLPDFRRTFSGAADIRPSAGSIVFGAIYLLNESQMQKLDRYEGAPRVYRRINVTVVSENQTLSAVAYQYATERKFSPPSQSYFNTIKNGLLAYGYGIEQITLLYKEANYSRD